MRRIGYAFFPALCGNLMPLARGLFHALHAACMNPARRPAPLRTVAGLPRTMLVASAKPQLP